MATNAPWLLKNQARNRNLDSEWSFSCRTTPYNPCSDSDSDSEHENNGSKISEETRLLNELDLSVREETVQYKPNPFSIAKINAASRGLPTKETTFNNSISRTLRSSSKPPVATIDRNKDKKGNRKIRPNASIIDGLRKQSQKAALASNLKKFGPVTSSFCSTVPPKPSISLSNSSNSKSFDPLVTSHVEISSPSHAVETNNVALRNLQGTPNVPVATHISTPDGPICAIPLSSLPESSQTAHITSSIDSSADKLTHIPSSVPVQEDLSPNSNFLEDEPAATIEDTSAETLANIELDTFPGASSSDATLIDAETFVSNTPVFIQSLNYSEGPPFLQQRRNLDASPLKSPATLAMEGNFDPSNLKSTVSDEPYTRPRPLSLSSPPQQQYTRTPASFTASYRFRAGAMSSPLRPADHLASRDMSSLRTPITPSHITTSTSLATPFSYQPRGRHAPNPHGAITMRRDVSTVSSLVHITDDDDLEESVPSLVDRPSLSKSSTPVRKITPGRTIKPSQLGRVPLNGPGIILTPHHSRDRIDDFGYTLKSEDATTHTEKTDFHASRGLITPTEYACVLPSVPDSVAYYPDTDHKHPHPPSPEPRTTKVRPRPVKDAYDFLSSDPDESWSTLPVKKKVKTRTPTPVIRTRKFRLPKLSLGNSKATATSKIEKTGMDATSARRVITFLPPPLKSAPMHLESESKVVPRAAYPSPSYSVLKSSSSSPAQEGPVCLQSQDHSPATDMGFKLYKPLSPPSSDSPCITSPDRSTYHVPIEVMQDREGQGDIHTPIDLPSIARLYPDMKAAWRERRRRIEEVWDLMGLSSCGRVYCDKTSDVALDKEGFEEIAIVVFRGN